MIPLKMRFDFVTFRRLFSARIAEKTCLFLAFLIPLIVRSVPELLSPVPIGFDTAIYLAQAKQLSSSPSILPFFARILGALYSLGVDLMVLMKVLPVLVFALTVFFSCLYARRRLGWSLGRILILLVVMSFSTAMLRMSWDLHRQSMATLFLLMYLFIDPWENLTGWKALVSVILVALIGLLHELVLVTVTAINVYLAAMAYRRKVFRNAAFFLVLTLMPMICYEIGVYVSYSRLASPFGVFKNLLAKWVWGGYSGLVSHAIGILVATFWYVLPLAPLGFFHDRYLTPWLVVMLAGYLSEIVVPFAAVRLADRWMLYMAIPLMFYAADGISRLAGSKRLRIAVVAVALVIVCMNGFSMLGVVQPFRLPSSLYIGFIPSTMVFSTAKPEHVVMVMRFSEIINHIADENSCVVTHDPWFRYWAAYLTDLKVYSFSGTNPKPAILNAMKRGCRTVFVIWFKGQVEDGEILAEGDQLALYRILSV